MRGNPQSAGTLASPRAQELVERVRAHFQALRALRKGLCLLNAGIFEQAVSELSRAVRENQTGRDFSEYLVRAHLGAGQPHAAAQVAAEHQAAHPDDIPGIVRAALTQWKCGSAPEALAILREGVAANPESAELHFQLGTMLAALDQHEEAELRFVQALAIDKDHADAHAALALACGARGDLQEALRHLQRAQWLRPEDARIALLLAQVSQAARAAGLEPSLYIEMPRGEAGVDADSVTRLARLIEVEPEFVEAFLDLDPADVDAAAFELLAETLKKVIDRNPQRAALHYFRGRVLDRLGRAGEAIAAAEQAVRIEPRCVQALILLAELYAQTDRLHDACQRLEESLRLGAEYADTYYLLGNLYRDDGQLQQARWAYEQALRINADYAAARRALSTLAA